MKKSLLVLLIVIIGVLSNSGCDKDDKLDDMNSDNFIEAGWVRAGSGVGYVTYYAIDEQYIPDNYRFESHTICTDLKVLIGTGEEHFTIVATFNSYTKSETYNWAMFVEK